MNARNVIVTGANTGIGFQAALALALDGAHVVVACRSKERGEAAVRQIKAALDAAASKEGKTSVTGGVELGLLDLERLQSIEEFAKSFLASDRPLHALILNAGIMPMLTQPRSNTPDRIEKCFGVNYLGHFLLTLRLLPALKQGAPSRVIAVSSVTHYLGGVFLDDLTLEREYTHDKAYTQSKHALVVFANEFNRRYQHLGIYANSLCPGVVASDILRDLPWIVRIPGRIFMRLTGKTAAQGASTLVYLASSSEVEGVGGKYFEDCKERPSHPKTYDEFIARKLWDQSIKMLAERGICLDEAAKEANIRDPVKNPKSEQTVNWLAYYVAIYGKAYLVVLFGVLMVTLLLLWII
jgi:retinol dehydrogenase-12